MGMSPDKTTQNDDSCPWCKSDAQPRAHFDCGTCVDWTCGSQTFCAGADMALPAGEYQSSACKRIVELEAEQERLLDHLHTGWGVIANAGARIGEGWSSEDPEWVKAAERWRDEYHKILDDHVSTEKIEVDV